MQKGTPTSANMVFYVFTIVIVNGDSVQLGGTKGSENTPSAETKFMLKLFEYRESVQILRCKGDW